MRKQISSVALLVITLLLAACGASGGGSGILFHNPVTNQDEFVMPGKIDLLFIPSDKPWSNGNYFDHELSPAEQEEYYSWAYDGYKSDPRLLSFLAEEQLSVKEYWEPSGLMVALPPETSLEDALTHWPLDYPDLFLSVSPVSAETGSGYYVGN